MSFILHQFIFDFLFLELEPYYDDAREPIEDTDEIDSEDEIVLVGRPKQKEYRDNVDERDF